MSTATVLPRKFPKTKTQSLAKARGLVPQLTDLRDLPFSMETAETVHDLNEFLGFSGQLCGNQVFWRHPDPYKSRAAKLMYPDFVQLVVPAPGCCSNTDPHLVFFV